MPAPDFKAPVKEANITSSVERQGDPAAQIINPAIKSALEEATMKHIAQDYGRISSLVDKIKSEMQKNPSLNEKNFKEENNEIDKLMRDSFFTLNVFKNDVDAGWVAEMKKKLNESVEKLCGETYGRKAYYVNIANTDKMSEKLREEFDNVDSMHKILIDLEENFGKSLIKELNKVGIMLGAIAAKMESIRILMRVNMAAGEPAAESAPTYAQNSVEEKSIDASADNVAQTTADFSDQAQ